jgi:hypothetical protein
VADLERGRRSNLHWSTALRLSAAMGLRAEHLLVADRPAEPTAGFAPLGCLQLGA